MPFGFAQATPTIKTGNVRTAYDPAVPPQTAAGTGVVPQMFANALPNTLGVTFQDQGGSDSVSGTAAQLPALSVALYKYVLYKSTGNPALIARPGVVYYTDNTFTVVSGAIADGVTGTAQDAAGIMMLNTTDVSGLTATILNNSGNGSGIWICIGGFVKGANAPASTAVGDYLVGSGSFILARVAAGTASTFVPVATALTAVAANASDMLVRLVPVE